MLIHGRQSDEHHGRPAVDDRAIKDEKAAIGERAWNARSSRMKDGRAAAGPKPPLW
jgi:hypothetical protein